VFRRELQDTCVRNQPKHAGLDAGHGSGRLGKMDGLVRLDRFQGHRKWEMLV